LTTVNGSLRLPNGDPATGTVRLTLVDVDGAPVPTAFLLGSDETLTGTSSAPIVDGAYTIDVPANEDIVPPDTLWARSHGTGRAASTIWLDVPTGDPVNEVDIIAPPTPGAT